MEAFVNSVPMFLVVILLVVGFAFLIKGADFFVEGSSSIAKQFKVPAVIIGLTIVAMGTSLPETSVSVTASIAGKNALAVSNAVGSNIFNLMVVIGVCTLLSRIPVEENTIKKDIPFSGLAAVMVLGLGILGFLDVSGMTLGHIDGVVLLALFVFYLVSLVKRTVTSIKEGKKVEVEGGSDEEIELLPTWKSIIFIIGGGIAIALGGDLTVNTASRIALACGMSQTLVGLTIVSIGTSLPELVTSIVAARKNEIGMALGNAIGSNIFNFLMVLGIASAISPIQFITENVVDIIVLLVFTVIVWLFARKDYVLNKLNGVLMLVMYAVYTVYIFIR
ncbi:MAG: calcium/sodium antiporter [Lachnospiraceae bacterium]|nr:calcium/sodium antiporter [Lachnospiraceae bacterium]